MKPLLSICIPTYNRDWCILEQIKHFKQYSSDIWDKIELVISDNCSTDNTKDIVERAIAEGLSCRYIRNKTNLGMDGNFSQCYQIARGKYVWLLGDDDFIVGNSLYKVLTLISESKKDFGIIHYIPNNSTKVVKYYNDNKSFLVDISYNMTFISGSIINTRYISTVNFNHYKGTQISQVPLVLNAILGEEQNILWGGEELLEVAKDYANNGGYNFFQVFVVNLLNILYEYFGDKNIYANLFLRLKKNIFQFVWIYVKRLLITRNVGNFQVEQGWIILFKHYGNEWYFWRALIKYPFGVIKHKLKKLL